MLRVAQWNRAQFQDSDRFLGVPVLPLTLDRIFVSLRFAFLVYKNGRNNTYLIGCYEDTMKHSAWHTVGVQEMVDPSLSWTR